MGLPLSVRGRVAQIELLVTEATDMVEVVWNVTKHLVETIYKNNIGVSEVERRALQAGNTQQRPARTA
jgi:hypothetical protein